MVSLVGDIWRGQTFKALESISISANCRLRRIFTMKVQPPDTVGDDGMLSVCMSGFWLSYELPREKTCLQGF